MDATHIIFLLVVQICLILGLSRVMGFAFVRIRQPQVMGEMVAGIMLGPSLLGLIFPTAFATVFPPGSVQYLNALSQIGVILFLFLVGLELDPKLIRNQGHAAIVISNASIIAPFLCGLGIAWGLYSQPFGHLPGKNFTTVALFMGAAMSVTAFPVLARILTERNLQITQVGAVAITCAAVNDVTAWCLLAFVIAIARAAGIRPGLVTAAEAIAYVLCMFLLVRPLLRRLQWIYERQNRLSQNLLAIVLVLVLASAMATESIGIHALFGAFVMGVIMPKGSQFVRALTDKLEDFTVVFLLPIFFAYTGLRTQIGLLNHPALWAFTGLIILAACTGKIGGSAVAARACGLSWRQASAIGVLMNTRGLMELVILDIGRDLGVITEAVFAMMIIMAIVTTALTTPLLTWVYPEAEMEALREAARKDRRWFTVLIPVSLPASAGPLARMALLLSPAAPAESADSAGELAVESSRRLIALHLRRPSDRDAYDAQYPAPAGPTPSNPSLEPVLAVARERHVQAEPISFVTRDVPSDIARVARARGVDLILMGFHKPVFGKAILGGTVHRVLTTSDTDVAILVESPTRPEKSADATSPAIKSVLVPYLGGKHDRLALELAGRVARNAAAALTVLHVVPPKRHDADSVLHARTVVDRTFNDPSEPTPVRFEVIEDASPVEAVIQQARQFDLVVIGVEEQWGLESHLFGWRPERIAREAATSLLIVRKYAGPQVGNPAESVPLESATTPEH